MSATADVLRDLHILHQRAKAIRDRMASVPKTLSARKNALAARQAELEKARKALQDAKVALKKNEHSLQAQQAKIDDLKVKLNLVKKNEEYRALQNQIAHDKASMSKVEDEILKGYEAIEDQSKAVAAVEAEVQAMATELAAMQADIDAQAVGQKAQLDELEAAIAGAEGSIPADDRERYRRTVRQFGADALAACEGGACLGCFTAVPPQMVNHLITADMLVFCKSCGRLLYLGEEDAKPTVKKSKARG
ncbi:Putative zinc ribbon domain protein [Aquisphaera giovannonii]|uniref:Zinc ribbon domain protein n=1 Tax=Aquisphaera giovannonii TaxID=406548 RepID=A0A5B9VXL9_9BACT|nr:C4-type zinc ribbon domain-containing protein [Aquisphaera giovannonii]QEH33022.1 Putative zinc ribbon domain protein [Aquisphaera giovannonii]